MMTGGERLRQKLAAIRASLADTNVVRAGVPENATYPDGTKVSKVAIIQEFGGTVTIPAHDTTVTRKVGKDGAFLRNGRFVKASQGNFETTHRVPEHTVTIPPRPFMRSTAKEKGADWAHGLGKALVAADYNAKKAFGQVGMQMQADIQTTIRQMSEPPNAPSTIRRKGSDKPLVASGVLLQSISHEVGNSAGDDNE